MKAYESIMVHASLSILLFFFNMVMKTDGDSALCVACMDRR